MKYILILAFLLMPFQILVADDALSVRYPLEPLIQMPPQVFKEPFKPLDPPTNLVEMAKEKAIQYGTDYETMAQVINCESSWQLNAHNLTKWEDSWGPVQINLLKHPDITVQQATDPDFAFDYLAQHMGKDVNWTCYTK